MLEWHQVILALSLRVACCSPTVIIIPVLLLYVQSINSELCYHKSVNEIIATSLSCCLSSVNVYPCLFYQQKKKRVGNKLSTLIPMVAYFCHHLSDNYVDLSDLNVENLLVTMFLLYFI